jgi:hypothetical protein
MCFFLSLLKERPNNQKKNSLEPSPENPSKHGEFSNHYLKIRRAHSDIEVPV